MNNNHTPTARERRRLAELDRLKLFYTPAEERFDRITRLAARLFDVPVAFISLVGEGCLWFKSLYGVPVDRADREMTFCTLVVEREAPLFIENTLLDPEYSQNPFVCGEPYMRCYAGIPLFFAGEPVGTLCIVDFRPREFGEQDRETLQALAHWVETEMQLSALSEAQNQLVHELDEVRRDALQDKLTRTWNRDGLELLFERELAIARRDRQKVTLMLLDIDFFKEVNDRHGHLAGDEVLKTVVERVRVCIRPRDVLARFGGDEFVVLALGSDREDTPALAERIASRVRRRPVELEDGTLTVTLSVGVTSGAAESVTRDTLLRGADRALYRAKADGRDCVRYEGDG